MKQEREQETEREKLSLTGLQKTWRVKSVIESVYFLVASSRRENLLPFIPPRFFAARTVSGQAKKTERKTKIDNQK